MKHIEAAKHNLKKIEANALNAEHFLEEKGWVKLSAGRVVYDENKALVPTIEQWECVLEWMRNEINKNALSGKRVYNPQKNMYFNAELIEQNVNAAQAAKKQ